MLNGRERRNDGALSASFISFNHPASSSRSEVTIVRKRPNIQICFIKFNGLYYLEFSPFSHNFPFKGPAIHLRIRTRNAYFPRRHLLNVIYFRNRIIIFNCLLSIYRLCLLNIILFFPADLLLLYSIKTVSFLV